MGCLTSDSLQWGKAEAKGPGRTGWCTLSCQWKLLHPSALTMWLFGVLSAAPGLHRGKQSKHLLTQISEAWIMRLVTPIPSKQLTSAPKSAQHYPGRYTFLHEEALLTGPSITLAVSRSFLGFFLIQADTCNKTRFNSNIASSHPLICLISFQVCRGDFIPSRPGLSLHSTKRLWPQQKAQISFHAFGI